MARLIPLSIAGASLLAGALVILIQARTAARLEVHLLEEDRLRLESTLHHAQDYFDAVYSTLLFISLDRDVQARRPDSHPALQRVFEHQWEHHRLAEIYVVERDFDGAAPPFQAFERDSEGMSIEKTHSLEREAHEYRIQRSQIARFLADTNLPALISPEIPLCVNGPDGRPATGLVCSLPILSPTGLVGIVSGMVPTHTILEVLRVGAAGDSAMLVNERGEIFGGPHTHGETRSMLQGLSQTEQGLARFFESAPDRFSLGSRVASWSKMTVFPGTRWWLVLLRERDAYKGIGKFARETGPVLLAAAIVLAGVALGLLVRAHSRRLEEQVTHLRERQALEDQMQEISEREQRRLGESLHEDLCQRLNGIQAASKALEKRLKAAAGPEKTLAGDIAAEAHEVLTRAQTMADELRPVALLDQGLAAALDRLTRHTQAQSGLPCRLHAEELPETLDPGRATHLYRVAQEALNNAVRHARASRIDVTLSVGQGEICLTVADNGHGMPETAAAQPGIGLRMMRSRCQRAGCRLTITSPPGAGTAIACRCPLPSEIGSRAEPPPGA